MKALRSLDICRKGRNVAIILPFDIFFAGRDMHHRNRTAIQSVY